MIIDKTTSVSGNTWESLDFYISVVFLPPYSPNLNPIEFIWKGLKVLTSKTFVASELHIKHIIQALFYRFSSTLSFARSQVNKFLSEEFIKCSKLCS
ncbi:MAG: transposase [Thermoplasmatales archaeon]